MTYRIPAANIARLRHDLERLNKKATKLGLAPIAIASETVETKIVTNTLTGMEEQHHYYVVEITGTTPVLAGWTFLAALKHVEGKVLVKVVAGATLPTEYLTATPDRCDHCHVRRMRLAAFVIRHEDERTMVVGRNCLADFIRTTSPEALAAQAEFLTSLDFGGYEDEDREDRDRGGSRAHHSINAEDYMVAVLAQIERDGRFISKKTAWKETTPKHPVLPTFEEALFVKVGDANEDERAKAREIIEWAAAWGAEADPSKDDYRFNVGVVASMEYVEDRVWPIFASIPSAKERAETKAQAVAAEAAKPSEWVGTVAKREVFTLTVTKPTKVIDGEWGDSYLYFLADKDGNDVRYFASRPLGVDRGSEPETLTTENELLTGTTRPLRVGDTIEIKATVKTHGTWQDRKQTTITRGAVVRLLTAGPATTLDDLVSAK